MPRSLDRRTFLVLTSAVLPGRAWSQTAPDTGASEDARLAAFFEKVDQERLQLSPETLTSRGRKERYGELDDHSEAAGRKWLALAQTQVAHMRTSFDRAKLGPSAKLSFDLFQRQLAVQKNLHGWYWQDYAVSAYGSSLDNIPQMLITQHRIDTVEDAQAYVSRLRVMERVANEVSNELDQRTAKGFLPPKLVFARVIPDVENQIKGAPFDSGPDQAIWADLKKKVAAFPDDAKARILADAELALKGEWRRGYLRYIQALKNMSEKAVENKGVWSLPKGETYYADMLKFHTTTDMTADQIHQIGLSEVARLRTEMEAIKATVGFQGSLEAFLDTIKTDPKFRYPNTDAGKQACLADAKKRVADYMAVAGRQFAKLPTQPLEVRAVEPFRERTAGVVPFYQRGTPDGSRPGMVYFNLSDMSQVLRPQLPGLTYHEGAPGHHFQLSRQISQTDLPPFRRFNNFTAYTEGWGLYAEGLAKEAGFYQDPFDDFGRLSLEIWRAVRLVLDTGIHAMRWTREQAVDYMRRNTLNSERDTQGEIDRYFTNPGQATGYKIGQMKFLSLRQKAAKAKGSAYDIRDFHEVVLRNGALPLDVLEAQVDAYINGR